jgi:hypothetical protein
MDSTIWRQHRHREHPVATSEAAVIKTLLVILLAVPLVSFAPVPSTPPAVYRVRLAIQTGAPAIAPLVQTGTWDTAGTGMYMGYRRGDRCSHDCANSYSTSHPAAEGC